MGKGVMVKTEHEKPPEKKREEWRPTEQVPLDPYRGLDETPVRKYDNGWPILGDAAG